MKNIPNTTQGPIKNIKQDNAGLSIITRPLIKIENFHTYST